MSYNCDICNYSTTNSSNLSHHRRTKKHILNCNTAEQNYSYSTGVYTGSTCKSTLMYTPVYTPVGKNYSCSNCEFSTNHKSSFYRHLKSCKNDNQDTNMAVSVMELKLKLEFAEKEKDLFKKLEAEKSELLNNIMVNANHIINKANDNTKITAQAMQTVSVSALKYANDKFKDTPALLPIQNFNINNLSFDNENDRKQLTEILIYNAKQNSLDKLLGDHIITCYKKDNPEEQSFHTTDCSRLNYIVRELLENAYTWSVDKNGIKICSSIIKPLIEKCIEILLSHQKELIEEMTTGDYKSKESVQIIISVLMSIDKGSLESDINKYIAPFFNLNKS